MLYSSPPTAAGGPYAPLGSGPLPSHKDIPLSELEQQQQQQQQQEQAPIPYTTTTTTSTTTTTRTMMENFPSLSSPCSSTAPGMGVMTMRRPLAFRDKASAAGFFVHLLGLSGWVGVATLSSSSSSSSSPSSTRPYILPRLRFSILAGTALAYFVVHSPLLLHRRSIFCSRRKLLLNASHFSLWAQASLLLVLLCHLPTTTFPFLLPFLLLAFLLVGNMWREQVYWRSRVNDQGEFCVVLADMTCDILSPSPALRQAAISSLLFQAGFLLCWSSLFAFAFSSSSLGRVLLPPLCLNLYWTSGLVQKTLHVCVSGSVARWFYSSMEEGEDRGQGKQEEEEGRKMRRNGLHDYDRAKNPFMDEEEEEEEEEEGLAAEVVVDDHGDATFYSKQQQARRTSSMDAGAVPYSFSSSSSSSSSSPSPSPSSSTLSHEVLFHHLSCALTVSFGSLCQAALCCPLAQVAWANRSYAVPSEDTELQAMPTTTSASCSLSTSSSSSSSPFPKSRNNNRTSTSSSSLLSSFIRRHHALSLTHIAAYKKPFYTATRDVWSLIVSSGLDSILRTDTIHHSIHALATTAACLLTLLTLLLFGMEKGGEEADSYHLLLLLPLLLLPGVFAYILTYTSLEPLLATVNTAYVCFAETPALVSQTFPLIFHRLDRIAEVRNF